MAGNSSLYVASWGPKVGGGVWFMPDPVGVLPTDATTALASGFKCLGPVSKEGVKPSRDTNVEKIKEWDGSTLAALLNDESRSFEFLLYGTEDPDVLAFIYGAANVTTVAATTTTPVTITTTDKGGKPPRGALVFEMVYGSHKKRLVVPVADANITGEEPWAMGALTGYTVEVEALKDATGVRAYDYYEGDMLAV